MYLHNCIWNDTLNSVEMTEIILLRWFRHNLSLDKRRKKMEVKKAAMAGTLESSDAQVTVEPGNGIELSI